MECVLLLEGTTGPTTRIDAFRSFAAELGVLFQIVDDILDVTGTDADLVRSVWVGGATRDFSVVDALAMEATLAQRGLTW